MHPQKTARVAALLLALSWSTPSALPADHRLLSLVPPSAGNVGGMNNRLMRGHLGAFLLITANSLADTGDFLAISGVDQDRNIQEVILVGNETVVDTHEEHSLLASGHFDKARIFKAAIENGAGTAEYRGVQMVVVSPFSRESKYFHDVRWLAVMAQKVFILGTAASVREELDRYLDNADPDPSLQQKVAQLGRNDLSWCLVRKLNQSGETLRALHSLDPAFPSLLHDGDTLLLGIRYGRRVRFEYEITTSARSVSANSHSPIQSLPRADRRSHTLMAASDQTAGSVRGKLEIPRNYYEKWFANVTARTPQSNFVISSN